MAWVRLAAFAGALVVWHWPTVAMAQGVLTERVRIQGGFTHEDRGPQGKIDDVWVGATPEVALVFDRPRTLFQVTYSLTGNLHTALPTEIGNRLTLNLADELSQTLNLIASAEAYQTSLSNLLTSQSAADTGLAALPAADSRFFGVHGAEGLSWDAGPRLLLRQGLDAGFVTSLDDAPTKNYVVNLTASAERTWKRDAIGLEARVGYAASQVTATDNQKIATFTAGPRWRHDFSERLSAYAAGGGTLVLSPDPGSGIVLASAARGSLLYAIATGGLELNAVSGVEPNLLTGQILRLNQMTMHGFLPLSERRRVFLGASIGYQDADALLVRRTNLSGDFHGFLADAELSWLPTDRVQLFARYQFVDQIADKNPLVNPSIMRNAAILGVQIFFQPPAIANVRFRTPQRVDAGDAAPPKN